MHNKIFSITILLIVCLFAQAQKKWNLQQCVEHAMNNNLSIKQVDLQTKIAEVQYKQSKQSKFPSLGFNGGSSFNSGRNQDPTSFELTTQSYISANIQLQSSADIFNWFSKRNTIAANQWELMAAKANTDKLKNDIALTVANAYLQILLAKEQQEIAVVQVQQSQAQLNNTRKLVNAGALPELNASELEAQLARDSAAYITSKGNAEQAMLLLKSYMSIDASAPFEIEVPPVEKIPVEKIGDLQPENVYALAMANMPQQRVNDFKLKAAQKNMMAAKGNMYPSISAFGALSSNYIAAKTALYQKIAAGFIPTGLRADAGGGTFYEVQTPIYQQGNKTGYARTDAFGIQLPDNFRQAIGINISVPIFNGYTLRGNYEKSKINVKNQQLQKEIDDQKLKQDIYQAYNAAVVALEKFNAGKKEQETAERAYLFAKKRYDVGMLSTFELITNQNNLFRAKLEYTLNQFDYVFKMKVLEFYKGQGLKL